jgi:hypothetical protein
VLAVDELQHPLTRRELLRRRLHEVAGWSVSAPPIPEGTGSPSSLAGLRDPVGEAFISGSSQMKEYLAI